LRLIQLRTPFQITFTAFCCIAATDHKIIHTTPLLLDAAEFAENFAELSIVLAQSALHELNDIETSQKNSDRVSPLLGM